MSTKLSKDDVKNPDQVLKTLNSGFQWSQNHSKGLLAAILAFVVIGVGYSIYANMADKKEASGQEAYAPFEKSYMDKKRGFDDADREALKPNPTKDPKAPAKAKASGDLEKDYGSEVAGFQKVMTEHSGTKAAQMAALNLSEIYLNYKKTDEAYQALQKVESQSQSKDLISSIVLAQYGNVLTEKNDCKSAIGQWEKVLARKEMQFMHDTLRLKSAFCYEKMNDMAKAEELYKKVSQNAQANPDTPVGMMEPGLGKEAEKYLRLLQLKMNTQKGS